MSTHTEKQAEAFRAIRSLMGHVQDGSDTPVTLYQDDATRSYFVVVGPSGSPRARHYHGESLDAAIASAAAGEAS